MGKTLKEQLERIHTITYGKEKILKENFIDDILGKVKSKEKKLDDPKKADLVTQDVNDFFKSLEKASADGLSQQKYGGMEYQKEVESLQIALILLGYKLPKYGVDGLFGPETAEAVAKFKNDKLKNQLSEVSMAKVSSLNNPNISTDNDETKYDKINQNLLDDIEKASNDSNVKVKITTAVSGHSEKNSRHPYGDAVDISIINGKPVKTNINDTNRFVNSLRKLGYIVNKEVGNQKAVLTYGFPGHDDHVHISNKEMINKQVSSTKEPTEATPEMITKLIELLRDKVIKPKDLQQHIDTSTKSSGFTELDLNTDEGFTKYSTTCQKFIDEHKPNPLNITGDMMAKSARNAFNNYNAYVPLELALGQLLIEGGIGNSDLSSRPIRTKNPFNVGNVDSGGNKYEKNVQSAIQNYYNLIAQNYLGKGRSPKDLLNNFVDKNDKRYASSDVYEKTLNQIISKMKKIS